MSTLAILGLIGLALFHSAFVILYWLKTEPAEEHPENENPETEFRPRTGVVLCLRGADPQLDDCLQGLAKQSNEFQLYCVFDNATDPAVAVVKHHEEEFSYKPILLFVENISDYRSLKCNSLLHALDHVDQSLEVLAFIDGDVKPDQHWLRELTTPLAEKEIAVTTGNRWFATPRPTFGSALRQSWNAAAIVQMLIYKIAWGGSWASKFDTIRDSKFAAHLKYAFCEDTAMNSIFDTGEIHRVPSLVTLSDCQTTMKSAIEFITRQLLTLRLYHRLWPLVLGHAVLVLSFNVLAVMAIIYNACCGNSEAVRQLIVAIFYVQIVNVFSLYYVSVRNEQLLKNRGIEYTAVLKHKFKFLWSAFVSQWIHPYCAIKAAFQKRTHWRGIEYEVSPLETKLIEYRPMSR